MNLAALIVGVRGEAVREDDNEHSALANRGGARAVLSAAGCTLLDALPSPFSEEPASGGSAKMAESRKTARRGAHVKCHDAKTLWVDTLPLWLITLDQTVKLTPTGRTR